jgi:hypothetical protein
MKTFANLTKRINSETVFYCVRIKNALGFSEKEIFVSCPLYIEEFREFIDHRIDDSQKDKIKIVESYWKITELEKKELYGLDSFARIISAINANILPRYIVTYTKNTTGELVQLIVNLEDATKLMGIAGANLVSIKPWDWNK